MSWIKVEEASPKEGETVLIRVKDYRRPKRNATEVSLGYYQNDEWYYECSGTLVNSGHGWFIEEWLEIPV